MDVHAFTWRPRSPYQHSTPGRKLVLWTTRSLSVSCLLGVQEWGRPDQSGQRAGALELWGQAGAFSLITSTTACVNLSPRFLTHKVGTVIPTSDGCHEDWG